MIHVDIPPFKAYVEEKFLFDLNQMHAGLYVPCKVVGVSSYKGEALTFTILLDNGSVFFYIPFHAISKRKRDIDEQALDMDDLVYKNCVQDEICAYIIETLPKEVSVYFKRKNLWLNGKYLLTIDWHTDNELFHLLELENGQYAAIPAHKIKWGDSERSLPDYEELHVSWIVEEPDE